MLQMCDALALLTPSKDNTHWTQWLLLSQDATFILKDAAETPKDKLALSFESNLGFRGNSSKKLDQICRK